GKRLDGAGLADDETEVTAPDREAPRRLCRRMTAPHHAARDERHQQEGDQQTNDRQEPFSHVYEPPAYPTVFPVRGCGVTVHNPAAVDSMRGRESFFPDGKHPSQS